jgi:hypothetical protein
VSNKNKPEIYVAWKTVTYRSVIMALLGAALIFFAVMHAAISEIFRCHGESGREAFQ